MAHGERLYPMLSELRSPLLAPAEASCRLLTRYRAGRCQVPCRRPPTRPALAARRCSAPPTAEEPRAGLRRGPAPPAAEEPPASKKSLP
ncbi:unnamed protein product [Urochloa humidicola]